ncbi:MAG: hypothetical protein EXS42_08975 [Lacunisphaera sp.]|nr:hypothetical protein [Lacunisphaera sp.]
MKIKAAVVPALDRLSIETVQVDQPKGDEILVNTVAAGFCHSDFPTCRKQFQAKLPLVLGHEGAGVVESKSHPRRPIIHFPISNSAILGLLHRQTAQEEPA